MKIEKITDINRNYLSDESRLTGKAEWIAFCKTAEDIRNAVSEAGRKGSCITVQGARTGITGGAVPAGCDDKAENSESLIINLSKMKQVYSIRPDKAGYRIKAGAGLTLTEIENILKGEIFDTSFLDEESLKNLKALKAGKYFFPPDPTEKSASIGGVTANCASGSRTFYYGSARNYILSVDVVLADSSELKLNRGDLRKTAAGNSFKLIAEEGVIIEGIIPQMKSPCCKNAAGIFMESGMEMIDLFIGSEGILGIISAVEFLVIPEPEYINSILIFPPGREMNFKLLEFFRDTGSEKDPSVRNSGLSYQNSFKKENSETGGDNISGFMNFREDSGNRKSFNKISAEACSETADFLTVPEGAGIAAVEYFDRNALSLLSRYINEGLFKSLFPFSEENSGGALYIEIHSENPDAMESFLEKVSGFLERAVVDSSCVFISDGDADLQRMKDFRHSIPESVNMTIDRIKKRGNEITKLGTDLAVPDSSFRELFEMYYSDLELSGLDSAVFGHAGNNHLHVNIIPVNKDQYSKGKELVRKWAEKAVSLDGTVSAEHGTGRLKKEYLEIMYGREGIEKLLAIKSVFDPGFIINRGVMI